MAAEMQSPSASEPVPAPNREELTAQLDTLLERYLHTLDAYQNAQKQLSSYLSSGYLSLAQANFSNHSRTRFGQDYYDERMQAQRKISSNMNEEKVDFAVFEYTNSQSVEVTESAKGSQARVSDPPEISSTRPEQDASNEDSQTNNASSGEKLFPDPIRWFGILVPPALRTAQASFVSAVDGPIPQAATLIKDLRKQEVDIGRLRKQIKRL